MRIGALTKTLLAGGVAIVMTACVEQPPPRAIPIDAKAADALVLEGEWSGSYWSVDTGRSGRIRFSLTADDDRAYGDVLMLPSMRSESQEDRTLVPANQRDIADPETLAIEFVRIDSSTETVSGTLEPYRDPDCDCIVSTTFTGLVSRDSIEGTFVMQAGGSHPLRRGNWSVERRD